MAEAVTCPKCGVLIEAGHEYGWCIKCGERFQPELIALLPVLVARRARVEERAIHSAEPAQPTSISFGAIPAILCGACVGACIYHVYRAQEFARTGLFGSTLDVFFGSISTPTPFLNGPDNLLIGGAAGAGLVVVLALLRRA